MGALLSIAWHKIQKRTLIHMSRLESICRKLEDKLEIPCEYSISFKREKDLVDNKTEKAIGQKLEKDNKNMEYEYLDKKLKARDIMKLCSILASVMWVIAAIIFFIYEK